MVQVCICMHEGEEVSLSTERGGNGVLDRGDRVAAERTQMCSMRRLRW